MNTRTTIQEMKILEYLRKVKTHPSAKEVYEEVRKEIPSITLATVYRNLKKLANQAKAIKLEVNGEYRFDGQMAPHQHIICEICGKLEDVMLSEFSSSKINKQELKKFTPTKVDVTIYGICEECQRKNKIKII